MAERGFILLAFVLFLSISAAAVFALVPSMDREDIIEAQRLRADQARAAAEGAIFLAIHRQADVPPTEMGRATARATLTRKGDVLFVAAEGRVPSLRDGEVRVEVKARFRPRADGSFRIVGWE